MRIILMIAMAALALPGCSSEAADLCDDVIGDYQSVELGAVYMDIDGNVVPGVELIEVTEEYFEHFYSDVVEQGDWKCSEGMLSALDGRFKAELRMDGSRLILDRNGFVFSKQS